MYYMQNGLFGNILYKRYIIFDEKGLFKEQFLSFTDDSRNFTGLNGMDISFSGRYKITGLSPKETRCAIL